MPVRRLNFQGYNPYRNLVNRDPALNGIASLGAALMNGPGTRADARKKAFDEEEKKSRDLFNEHYQQERGRAQDEDRAQTHRDSAAQRKQQAAQLKETFQFHKQAHYDSVNRLKADSEIRGQMVTNKSKEAKSEAGRKDLSQEEDVRHHKALEKGYADRTAAATTKSAAAPKQREAGMMANDIWNHSRQASYTKDAMGNAIYDPILHQQNYNKLRDLTGRQDIPQWKDAQGAQSAQPAKQPPAAPDGQSFMTPRRSGQPGVHTLGDLTGGVVDLWNGPSQAAPTTAPTAMPKDVNDASHPVVKQMDSYVQSLDGKDRAALTRILMSQDHKLISAANDRIMEFMQRDSKAAAPPKNETGEGALFDGEPDQATDE